LPISPPCHKLEQRS